MPEAGVAIRSPESKMAAKLVAKMKKTWVLQSGLHSEQAL